MIFKGLKNEEQRKGNSEQTTPLGWGDDRGFVLSILGRLSSFGGYVQ